MSSGFISRSHRGIEPFVLHRPATPIAAAQAIASGGRPHAGGIDLVESMQQGTKFADVVSLGGVADLDAISVEGDRLLIGATTTHAGVETAEKIVAHRPDLAHAWTTVGNVRIRKTGTVGGNLMALDKDYDAAPILGAADARLHFLTGDGGSIEARVADRYDHGENLLTHISVPIEGHVIFDRTLKPAISVAVGADHISIGCAVATTLVADRPSTSAGVNSLVDSIEGWVDDAFASATYRQRMAGVLLKRLLEPGA